MREVRIKSHCHYCGAEVRRLGRLPDGVDAPDDLWTEDHIESQHSPRREGTDTVIACYRCNQIKGNAPYDVFRFWISRRGDRPPTKQDFLHFCHELMIFGLAELLEDEIETAEPEPPKPDPVYTFVASEAKMSRRRKALAQGGR